jgi:hypothetical protein
VLLQGRLFGNYQMFLIQGVAQFMAGLRFGEDKQFVLRLPLRHEGQRRYADRRRWPGPRRNLAEHGCRIRHLNEIRDSSAPLHCFTPEAIV